MKCDLMKWLREANKDIPAFPIGAPFRPKEEIKPEEIIHNLPSQKKMEEVKLVYPADKIKIFEPEKAYKKSSDSIKNHLNVNIYGDFDYVENEVKSEPQSEWRTGKPEKDGVYKVLVSPEAEFFCRFLGCWMFIYSEKTIAEVSFTPSLDQNKQWKPIEE